MIFEAYLKSHYQIRDYSEKLEKKKLARANHTLACKEANQLQVVRVVSCHNQSQFCLVSL